MRAGRVGGVPAALAVVCVTAAGCGHAAPASAPAASALPLLPGAAVVSEVRNCDQGSNAFCATELVVVDRRFKSSQDLLVGEHAHLLALGWSGADGDIGAEHAATSPQDKLRLTYATPFGDLEGIDLGWIHRSQVTARALSRAMFAQSPALSMMLEPGPS